MTYAEGWADAPPPPPVVALEVRVYDGRPRKTEVRSFLNSYSLQVQPRRRQVPRLALNHHTPPIHCNFQLCFCSALIILTMRFLHSKGINFIIVPITLYTFR
jgi:hypothetical protein